MPFEGLRECRAREVGAHLIAEHELRIGSLPWQEVGQALLAARANDQIWIVHVRCIETVPELIFAALAEPPGGVQDLRPPSIVECDEQHQTPVGRRYGFRPLHLLDQRSRSSLAATHKTHPDTS